MADDARTLRDALARIIPDLWPWIERVRLVTTGGLAIRTAARRLHLEGDASDPGVARVGDLGEYEYVHVNLALDIVSVYRSKGNGSASVWSAVASGPLPPIDGVTVGTPITITTGSGKVTCG